jgi:hypothetical protein
MVMVVEVIVVVVMMLVFGDCLCFGLERRKGIGMVYVTLSHLVNGGQAPWLIC